MNGKQTKDYRTYKKRLPERNKTSQKVPGSFLRTFSDKYWYRKEI
jgi:hypothetical protein